jgi:hypothetical protein
MFLVLFSDIYPRSGLTYIQVTCAYFLCYLGWVCEQTLGHLCLSYCYIDQPWWLCESHAISFIPFRMILGHRKWYLNKTMWVIMYFISWVIFGSLYDVDGLYKCKLHNIFPYGCLSILHYLVMRKAWGSELCVFALWLLWFIPWQDMQNG